MRRGDLKIGSSFIHLIHSLDKYILGVSLALGVEDTGVYKWIQMSVLIEFVSSGGVIF